MKKPNKQTHGLLRESIFLLVIVFTLSLFTLSGCHATKNTVRLYTCSGETYTTYSKTGYKKSRHRVKFLRRYNKLPR
jgi:hypothetical protein